MHRLGGRKVLVSVRQELQKWLQAPLRHCQAPQTWLSPFDFFSAFLRVGLEEGRQERCVVRLVLAFFLRERKILFERDVVELLAVVEAKKKSTRPFSRPNSQLSMSASMLVIFVLCNVKDFESILPFHGRF